MVTESRRCQTKMLRQADRWATLGTGSYTKPISLHWPFQDRKVEAENVHVTSTYANLTRFLVILQKPSQNTTKKRLYLRTHAADFSQPWTDEKLYKPSMG